MKKRFLLAALAAVLLTGSSLPLETVNQPTVVLAKRHRHRRKKVKKSRYFYKKSHIVLPAGYTAQAVKRASQAENASQVDPAFKRAAAKGMAQNSFSRNKYWAESKRDSRTKVNLRKLTKKQKQEIAGYSLRLINDARRQLGLPLWRSSKGTQKLADDIAREYSRHKKSIKTGHYVAGITRACKKNGLTGPFTEDNYVEDMAGFYSRSNKTNMTQLKKDVYFGLKQMLFGYAGNSESGRKNMALYTEWQHAGDLLNMRGSAHDGDYDYYGFSISAAGRVYSLHYIGVPSFAVKDPSYNKSFCP